MNRAHPSAASRCLPSILGLLVLAGVGCARPPVPLEVDAAFPSATLDTITLLPVIDARADKFEHVAVARNVADASVRVLESKGYHVALEPFAADAQPLPDSSVDWSGAELVAIAPATAPVFLVVRVESVELESDAVGTVSRVKLYGVLVERATGRVLWRDRAAGINSFSGLMVVLTGSTDYEAANNAARSLFHSLPQRIEPPG